ncbi:MAG: phosphopantetheine-binding protein [Pikeienuella sp.]
MVQADTFLKLLRKYAKSEAAGMDDRLFGDGLDMSSIAFTEMIMQLEDECDIDIDIDDLDASITTAGQLFERLSAY